MGSIPKDGGKSGYPLSISGMEGEGQPQFRAYAANILEFLQKAGLPAMDVLSSAPEANAAVGDPQADTGPHDPHLRRFRLDNGQTVYLHLDARLSPRGYKEVAVLAKEQAEERLVASRAERAIVAATAAIGLRPIDEQRLRKALGKIEGPLTKSAREHANETARKIGRRETRDKSREQRQEDVQRGLEFMGDLQVGSLEYVLALLRHYRPNFDELPRSEQGGLILLVCQYLNNLLGSVRALTHFLEHGSVTGLPNNTVTALDRYVRAAILREMAKLSHREIGEELGLGRTPSDERKGDHAAARKSAQCGRKFLQTVLGEDGWRERRDRMRADAARYSALSESEKLIERLAHEWGQPIEEARERRERVYQQRLEAAESSGLLDLSEEEQRELRDHWREAEQGDR